MEGKGLLCLIPQFQELAGQRILLQITDAVIRQVQGYGSLALRNDIQKTIHICD